MSAVFLALLATVLLFKCGTYLLRWYEVTGAEDFVPEGPARHLARGALPFLREYAVTLLVGLVWCVEMPWRQVSRRRPPPPAPEDAPPDVAADVPVVLVHGFSLTPWSMAYLAWRLRAAGRRVHLLDYHPMLGDIDGFVPQLAALVDRVAGPEGAAVDLVGHSMGGLIAARYHVTHPGRVRALVAVATPFRGTRLWAMSVGRSLPQMRPGSAFLRELRDHPDLPGRARVTCLCSPFDQVVLPYRSCRLDAPGVRNVVVPGLGHAAILLSPRVASEVVAAAA